MQFKIISIGKIKNKNLLLEIEDLKKRILRLDFLELKEIKDKNIDIIKKKEFEQIKSHISPSNFNILLTEFGKEFSTQDFYEKLKNITKPICFIINGPYGPCDELRKCVDLELSLSKMVFTHEIAKLLLVEQLYRVECFEKNIPYTK